MIKRVGLIFLAMGLIAGSVTSQLGCPGNTVGGNTDGGTLDGGGVLRPPINGLVALTITPQTATLTVDNVGQAKTQNYTAIGHFTGQPDRDVMNEVNWQLDTVTIGNINSSGVFTTSNQAGDRETSRLSPVTTRHLPRLSSFSVR